MTKREWYIIHEHIKNTMRWQGNKRWRNSQGYKNRLIKVEAAASCLDDTIYNSEIEKFGGNLPFHKAVSISLLVPGITCLRGLRQRSHSTVLNVAIIARGLLICSFCTEPERDNSGWCCSTAIAVGRPGISPTLARSKACGHFLFLFFRARRSTMPGQEGHGNVPFNFNN